MNWTCDETRRDLLRQDTLSAAALEHLAQCAVCQEMMELPTAIEVDAGSIANADALELPNLLRQTELRLSTERGLLAWLRSRKTPLRVALGVGMALVPAAVQLVFFRRTDLSDYPLSRLLLAAASYMVIAAFAITTLLSPLYRPRSRWTLWLATLGAFSLPFVIAALAPAYAQRVGGHANTQHSFLYQAWVCLRYGTLLSLPAVLPILAMDRQSAPIRRVLTLAAGIGGVAGNLSLLLHCPNEQPAHQLVGHATVSLLLLVCLGIVIVIGRIRTRTPPEIRRAANG
jgi:hypothetical protein